MIELRKADAAVDGRGVNIGKLDDNPDDYHRNKSNQEGEATSDDVGDAFDDLGATRERSDFDEDGRSVTDEF